jgi:hypothetical protein
VVPRMVENSLLIAAIRHESLEMPPDKKLPERVIADFVKWVQMGAPNPGDGPPLAEEVAEDSWQSMLRARGNWWSLQPVHASQPPVLEDNNWSDRPIDRFILARLREAELEPATSAGASTLLRRLSLVLTGLPPSIDGVQRFADQRVRQPDEAYARLVERLLDSPQYGERWARHWMDVVRFSETHGYEWNHEIRDAWRYRDYLIRAFNADVAYNQFIREHIAGDLLDPPRVNDQLGINESVIGTAFWRFSELGHDDCDIYPEIRYDALDNQIDTLTKAFQAMTVSCARCHDHKLDAISTANYYALVGILESSRPVVQTLDLPQTIAAQHRVLKKLKQDIRLNLGERWLDATTQLDQIIVAALVADSGDDEVPPAVNALAKQISRQEVPVEDPVHVLQRFVSGASASVDSSDSDIAGKTTKIWQRLKQEYHAEQAARAQFNADNFAAWGTFCQGEPQGWQSMGMGLSEQACRPGEFVVAVEGDTVVSEVLPAGVYTHLFSDRPNGTLHSPWLPTERKYLSV